jgi:hypothetical protein
VADASPNLDQVGDLVAALTEEGFQPVLVGGMALVILGSQRITRDFDFVIAAPGDRVRQLVEVCYARGFALVSRLNDEGLVTATIDNPRVAAIRIRLDGPDGVFFFNRKTRLRIDLLFDFPIAAATLAERARAIKIRSRVFTVASEDDLLHLKQIARAGRNYAGDAQDIEFLEARRERRMA